MTNEHEGSLPRPLAQGLELAASIGKQLTAALGTEHALQNIVEVEQERLIVAADAQACVDALHGDDVIDPRLIAMHLHALPNDEAKMSFLMEHEPYHQESTESPIVLEPGQQPPNWDLAAVMAHAEEVEGFRFGPIPPAI